MHWLHIRYYYYLFVCFYSYIYLCNLNSDDFSPLLTVSYRIHYTFIICISTLLYKSTENHIYCKSFVLNRIRNQTTPQVYLHKYCIILWKRKEMEYCDIWPGPHNLPTETIQRWFERAGSKSKIKEANLCLEPPEAPSGSPRSYICKLVEQMSSR